MNGLEPTTIAAAVAGVIAIPFALRKAQSTPAALMGAIFLSLALVGGPLWEWSRANNGAGLPGHIVADPVTASLASAALSSAAIGCFVAACLLLINADASFADIIRRLPVGRAARAGVVLSSLLLGAWLVGQGPSVLDRRVYLATDGVESLLRAVSLIGPLASAAVALVGFLTLRGAWSLANIALAVTWWCATASTGTRLAAMFPAVLALAAVAALIARPSLARWIAAIGLAYFGTFCVLATLILTLVARGTPHGILNLPDIIREADLPHLFDVATWRAPASLLVSSVVASFPLTGLSVGASPGLAVIIPNLNPLPSDWLGLDTYADERLWPYFWVPLSFAGELYGAAGSVATATYFGIVAVFAGLAVRSALELRLTIGVPLVTILALFVGLMAIQYPSRSVGRIASIIAVIAIALAIFVARKRRIDRIDLQTAPVQSRSASEGSYR